MGRWEFDAVCVAAMGQALVAQGAEVRDGLPRVALGVSTWASRVWRFGRGLLIRYHRQCVRYGYLVALFRARDLGAWRLVIARWSIAMGQGAREVCWFRPWASGYRLVTPSLLIVAPLG